jgi:hypothetical protein
MSWFSSIVESIKTVATTVTQRIVEPIKETIQVASTVVSWVQDAATKTVEAISYVVTHPVEVIKQIEKTIKTVVKTAVKVAIKVAKTVNEIRKDPVGSLKKAAAAVVKTAKVVAHAVKAAAVKAGKWIYENRKMILSIVAEIAISVALTAITGGVGLLALRGVMLVARYASAAGKLAATARRFEVGLKAVSEGKQGKHLLDHKNFMKGKSEVSEDPTQLISRGFGRGRQVGDKGPGQAGFKEKVTYDENIGTHVAQDGTRTPTNSGIIHYNGKGEAHIVPAMPE